MMNTDTRDARYDFESMIMSIVNSIDIDSNIDGDFIYFDRDGNYGDIQDSCDIIQYDIVNTCLEYIK